MDVEGRKCQEQIFETRIPERLQEVGGRVTPGAVTEESQKINDVHGCTNVASAWSARETCPFLFVIKLVRQEGFVSPTT